MDLCNEDDLEAWEKEKKKMIVWKINGIYKADAEIVYSEIQSIGNQYTPQQIVDKARDSSTELHKLFEWDDSKAAESYRCIQAQNIIRMLVIQPEENAEESKIPLVRAIVSQNASNHNYEPIQITVRNDESYQRLLKTALKELDAFKTKYSKLPELESVIEAIEETLRCA